MPLSRLLPAQCYEQNVATVKVFNIIHAMHCDYNHPYIPTCNRDGHIITLKICTFNYINIKEYWLVNKTPTKWILYILLLMRDKPSMCTYRNYISTKSICSMMLVQHTTLSCMRHINTQHRVHIKYQDAQESTWDFNIILFYFNFKLTVLQDWILLDRILLLCI